MSHNQKTNRIVMANVAKLKRCALPPTGAAIADKKSIVYPLRESDITAAIRHAFKAGQRYAEAKLKEERRNFQGWTAADVRERDASLSDQQCLDVLALLEKQFDANIGVSWDTIDDAIDSVLNPG